MDTYFLRAMYYAHIEDTYETRKVIINGRKWFCDMNLCDGFSSNCNLMKYVEKVNKAVCI